LALIYAHIILLHIILVQFQSICCLLNHKQKRKLLITIRKVRNPLSNLIPSLVIVARKRRKSFT